MRVTVLTVMLLRTKQIGCKVCKNLFTTKTTYHDEIHHNCPKCEYILVLHHERGEYDVLVCPNDNCSFYLKNKALLKDNKANHLKTHTNGHKLRYTTRLFHFNLDEIKEEKLIYLKYNILNML